MKKPLSLAAPFQKFLPRTSPSVLLFIAYVFVALTSMIFFGVGIYPDRLVALLLIPVLILGQARPFLRDWLPFLVLLFAYEYLRGIVGVFDSRVHYFAAPKVDMAIWGGNLPTVWLQAHLFNSNNLQWYDYLLTFSYLLHFVAPIIFALALWLTSRDRFARFTGGFLLLSYAGLTTYLLFPAAPPWMASDQHLIPHVTKILDQTMAFFPSRLGIPIPTIYEKFDPNLVAAIPSLHSAYPAIILLFAVRFFRHWGLLLVPYAISVWLMVIYFGEHYFIDVILGIAYAAASFCTIEFLVPRLVPVIKNWWATRHSLPVAVETVATDS